MLYVVQSKSIVHLASTVALYLVFARTTKTNSTDIQCSKTEKKKNPTQTNMYINHGRTIITIYI